MMKAVVFHRRLVYGLHVYVYIYSQIQQNIVSERALILFADFWYCQVIIPELDKIPKSPTKGNFVLT